MSEQHQDDLDPEAEEEYARLRESFRQQEDLLGELTGALKRNQDKLQGREIEVQVGPSVSACVSGGDGDALYHRWPRVETGLQGLYSKYLYPHCVTCWVLGR